MPEHLPRRRTFPSEGPITIDCTLAVATLNVELADHVAEVVVELQARDATSDVADRTTVDLRGSHLAIRGPRPSRWKRSILEAWLKPYAGLEVRVVAPATSGVRVAVFDGDVTVHGPSGPILVAGGRVAVQADDVRGAVRLRGGYGRLRIREAREAVTARCGACEIDIDHARAPVTVQCASGSLRIGVADAVTRLRTGAAGATIEAAYADVNLMSGAGSHSIGLPPGQAARLDIVTGSGRLISDLPLTSHEPQRQSITIRARTGSGDIRLHRATVAARQAS